MQWDSSQYLKFKAERTQPSIDLARRIPLEQAERVLDIGCGPGNSSRVLAGRFPGAKVMGVDSSPEMIETARREHPDLSFQVLDAGTQLGTLEGGFDVVFSNACIQWIPGHPALLKNMMALLRPGGVLAVQTPMNYEEPIHRLIQQAVESPRWKAHFPHPRIFYNLTQSEYIDLLAELSPDFSVWQTTYLHILPSHRAILEWYRGTGLRPYLSVLDKSDADAFEREIFDGIVANYPQQKNGSVVFRFPRFFFTASGHSPL